MSEKPDAFTVKIHLAKGHDHFWNVIQDLDRSGSWSVTEVLRQSKTHRSTVRDFIHRLKRAEFIKITGEVLPYERTGGEALYRLVKNQRTTPRIRRDGTILPERINDTLWRTIKILKRFSADELALAASTVERPINKTSAQSYIKHLLRVGILRRTGKSGEKNATYYLVRNLGAHAPQILKTLLVFDPNSHEIIGADDAREI